MRWASLATFVGAGVLLAVFWGEVPARWVTHWGPNGLPNGWATKSVPAAVGPMLGGVVAWLTVESIALGMLGRKGGASPDLVAVHATVLRAVGLAVALLTSGLALALPLLRPRSPGTLVVAALAELGLVIGGAMGWAARRTRRLRASGGSIPDGYQGAFYKNPRDQRLWVPKVSGLGWTINYAHRLAWPVTVALVGVPLLLAALLAVAGRATGR